MLVQFFQTLWQYIIAMFPYLLLGLFIGGLIHELVPSDWVSKHLGRGLKPIMYASVVGTIMPLCCYGAIPVALSFYRKGASLGPVLAFLVATPATSITALLVCYSFMGLRFTAFLFLSVCLMGFICGVIGNFARFEPGVPVKETCPHCHQTEEKCTCNAPGRLKSIFKYGFVDTSREIGPWLALGLVLAAIVTVFIPNGVVEAYLGGSFGYLFSVVFGLLVYICPTGSVPFIASLIGKGMNPGAGLVLLLLGPVTNYGALLIIWREFHLKVLVVYLTVICVVSLTLGWSWMVVMA